MSGGSLVKFCAVKRQIFNIFGRDIKSSIHTNRTVANIYSVQVNGIRDEERQQFNGIFPDITRDLINVVEHQPHLCKWYTKLLEYNVPNGRQRRGQSMLLSYKLLEDPQKLTPEKLRLANILGWCTELINSAILVSDDLMEQSERRRGRPCWYKLDGIGLSSVNDGTILEGSAYMLLKKHFRHHPCYLPIMELFHEIYLKTCIGQSLDYRIGHVENPNLEHISMDNYKTIVRYKTEGVAVTLPIRTAMYLAEIDDVSLHQMAEYVSCTLGYLMQIKNDFLDCFGQEITTGKTLYDDIREGTCVWPAVVTLQRATPAQRDVMKRCYGRSDAPSVQAVMDVYRALDIPSLYASHEKEVLKNINTQIEQLDARLPKKMFHNILQMC